MGLVEDRDRIGLEIGRLTSLLSSIEDPGPFYIPGCWQERFDGGAKIQANTAQPGFGWPCTVPNPDYIADETVRAARAADIQQEIAALQAQLAGIVAQFYGSGPGTPSQTVVTVTTQNTPAGPVQVVSAAPIPGASGGSTAPSANTGGKQSPGGPLPPGPSANAGTSPQSVNPASDTVAIGADAGDAEVRPGFAFAPNVPRWLVLIGAALGFYILVVKRVRG